jgi:hypothetical protein
LIVNFTNTDAAVSRGQGERFLVPFTIELVLISNIEYQPLLDKEQ